jgi:hypothetical protein
MTVIIEGGIDIGPGIGIGGTPPSPPAPGPQEAFTTPGTFSWTAPAGVTSVCVVAVGAGGGGIKFNTGDQLGGGGAGGGLGWKNNISVTPGQSYTVVVGAGGTSTISGAGTATDGGDSYFINTSTVAGFGGERNKEGSINASLGGTYVGDGGGNGGTAYSCSLAGGGGGGGGYTNNGGAGGEQTGSLTGETAPLAGGGGGGGGTTTGTNRIGGAGGGVGILGKGSSGAGGAPGSNSPGSPGSNGTGKNYGGGANGSGTDVGSGGAVRIIWGAGRAFPATNTGDLPPTPSGTSNVVGYNEMPPPVTAGGTLEDVTATINGSTGFTINNPSTTGISINGLTASNETFFATYGTGTKTVTWGAGSTVASSTVNVVNNNPSGFPQLVFFIVGQSGPATYNYPFTFI